MKDLQICDGCGRRIFPGEIKYVLRIEIFADFEELEIDEEELLKDQQAEIKACLEKIKNMDPEELEDEVHKEFDFTLCKRCQESYIENPLHPLAGESGDPQVH